MYITKSEAKSHLNIDSSFKDDDDLIVTYIKIAESACEKHLNKPLSECLVQGELDGNVKGAILLLIGTYYANREAVTYGKPVSLPYAVDYLLSLSRNHTVG